VFLLVKFAKTAFSLLFHLRYSSFSRKTIRNFQSENTGPGFIVKYWLEIAVARLIFACPRFKKVFVIN
jgi:hypothetical protein